MTVTLGVPQQRAHRLGPARQDEGPKVARRLHLHPGLAVDRQPPEIQVHSQGAGRECLQARPRQDLLGEHRTGLVHLFSTSGCRSPTNYRSCPGPSSIPRIRWRSPCPSCCLPTRSRHSAGRGHGRRIFRSYCRAQRGFFPGRIHRVAGRQCRRSGRGRSYPPGVAAIPGEGPRVAVVANPSQVDNKLLLIIGDNAAELQAAAATLALQFVRPDWGLVGRQRSPAAAAAGL